MPKTKQEVTTQGSKRGITSKIRCAFIAFIALATLLMYVAVRMPFTTNGKYLVPMMDFLVGISLCLCGAAIMKFCEESPRAYVQEGRVPRSGNGSGARVMVTTKNETPAFVFLALILSLIGLVVMGCCNDVFPSDSLLLGIVRHAAEIVFGVVFVCLTAYVAIGHPEPNTQVQVTPDVERSAAGRQVARQNRPITQDAPQCPILNGVPEGALLVSEEFLEEILDSSQQHHGGPRGAVPSAPPYDDPHGRGSCPGRMYNPRISQLYPRFCSEDLIQF
ncbi:hypothetical protein NHE_0078 [Neorickettsia helminthoeca str. Oregon]|uniref:Transmembrane protein n=1 Tax=Neorickettsia helminthoeca str. Oregon TaxID=1286528 RepID=X5HJ22_9RICK|nr:hypothetical protein [Neorickettsia helminthoeca]AHX11049.1 hypothetical protein NHE_0078 [Neorickettsia helminthoeca str. Oregon]